MLVGVLVMYQTKLNNCLKCCGQEHQQLHLVEFQSFIVWGTYKKQVLFFLVWIVLNALLIR